MSHIVGFHDFPGPRGHRQNEAFDDERMKSRFEIDWLGGDLPRQIVSGEWGETVWLKGKFGIGSVIDRLIAEKIPQLIMFQDLPEIPGVKVEHRVAREREMDEFGDTADPDGKIFFFIVSNPQRMVAFGLKVLKFNKFDLFMVNGTNVERKRGLTLQDVAEQLKQTWLPSLDYFDNPELSNYGVDSYRSKIN